MDCNNIKHNAAASGVCRENFCWYFLEDSLYIEGNGALDYAEDWGYFYDPPVSESRKRNKPVIHPWKELIPQIRHIEIAPGCMELGLGCFEEHYALETVTIPDTVRKIGVQAFYGCRNLLEVVIPESVEEIEDLAFCGCISMKSAVVPKGIQRIGYQSFAYCKELADLRVPETVGEIGEAAFLGVANVIYRGSLKTENF